MGRKIIISEVSDTELDGTMAMWFIAIMIGLLFFAAKCSN
jgi:hypothetical protein